MTAMSKIARARAPEGMVVLPPAAFADGWPGRPSVEVCVGLRRLSQADLDTARREAERVAVGFYDELRGQPRSIEYQTIDEVRNDELLIVAVGRAMTDPNDVSRPYFAKADPADPSRLIGASEDTVRYALTPEGLRLVWDEIVLMTVAGNVARRRADDAEVRVLARVLARGDRPLSDEARMLCAFLLEDLSVDVEVELAQEGASSDDEEDEDVAVHVVRAE